MISSKACPPWPEARLIAASTLSLGMLMARAFWMMRRSEGLLSGFGPPAFTAIVISLPIRAKAFDILSQRANMVALRVSKIRPMRAVCLRWCGDSRRASARDLARDLSQDVDRVRELLVREIWCGAEAQRIAAVIGPHAAGA